MTRPSSALRVVALLGATALLVPAVLAQSSNVLVIDVDAESVSPTSAGAVFNINTLQATDTTPVVEASAVSGAPFEYLAGGAISPFDGRLYVADWGSGAGAKVVAVAADGTTEVIAQGAPLVQPYGLTFDAAGKLYISDWEADPSGYGPDNYGGVGHGAIFVVDVPACTAPCTPAVLSDGRSHVFGPGVFVAYEDPVDVEWNPIDGKLYVADLTSSPAPYSWSTSVFRVDPVSGVVEAITATRDVWTGLINLAVRPDGSLLAVDTGTAIGDSSVWEIDITNTDPEANSVRVTGGTQYSVIESVSVDELDRVFVVDSGEYDAANMVFIQVPAVYRVDEALPPDGNAVLRNDSDSLVTPVWIGAVKAPTVTSVSPTTVLGPTNLVITGTNLFPGIVLDFGSSLAVTSVDWAPGQPLGTALQVVVAPVAAAGGCSLDLLTAHPFGPSSVFADAVVNGTPLPPRSTQGDANGDRYVDGLDLAILGRVFGSRDCITGNFVNDADFNDDSIVDGLDLAILAAYFGVRL
jgi:hypothetical protein